MGEAGHLEKALKSIKTYVIGWSVFSGLIIVGVYWAIDKFLSPDPLITLGLMLIVSLFVTLVISSSVASNVSKPLKAVSQAILHVSPSPIPIPAPNIEQLSMGKELVATLTRQIYDFASKAGSISEQAQANAGISLQQLPVGIIALDDNANITYANPKIMESAGTQDSILGKNLYSLFDIVFREGSLQEWSNYSEENSVIAQKIWHGIKLTPFEGKSRFFDLAACYSKNSQPGSTQTVLIFFEETDVYQSEADDISFISLAVHELRTPLTILRGYIEIFNDELGPNLTPEMQQFMKKMQASAENLTAFVSNILKVAKVEENQLSLQLHEENWAEVLQKIISDMQLRAEVYGKKITLEIAPNIPTAGIDRISIAEVLNNLVDNAIKYSPADKQDIIVKSYVNQEGYIETFVQDFGLGIPAQVVPNLFEKFSRNHRNKNVINGTGLGLFLSKALVAAHKGNIWVRSEEGQGSIFTFTVVPFAKLADSDKNGDNGLTRSGTGWIKNHSLARH